ncbi:MAG: DUF4965 domain-containing protein [Treponema sp.]|jgi:hypothetical protein|nr:DUF4965 domain-containing protein [Treponema sp.]
MNTRVPSVPLITIDPYFSIWSPYDRLYDGDTVHWTGRTKRIGGTALIDGKHYQFMGRGSDPDLVQKDLEITATSSRYVFEGAGIRLELVFLSPLLLSDLDLLSRPVSYIQSRVSSIDGKKHKVELVFHFSNNLCKNTDEPVPLRGGLYSLKNCRTAWTGRRHQAPLSHSGDDVAIDWGYLYLAVPEGRGSVSENNWGLWANLAFEGGEGEAFIAAAYDDIASMNYFGEIRRGYWARNGKTILQAIEEAVDDFPQVKERCAAFDRELGEKALAAGGEAYRLILNLAYRQTIAAHKLITDEAGEAVFISKECFSNGCAATVDVSYPSTPLYLLYNPELVKGMLRPIFRFAKLPVWTFDFAPHDAGRFPHVTGQVYGLNHGENFGAENGETFAPLYQMPAGADAYQERYQMPVEECGNMLIMMAAVAKAEGNAEFSRPHRDLAEKWARYLIKFGANPGEQLCTDDFAGHLASNCNLSAKAIMGLESCAILFGMWGDAAKAAEYRAKAKEFAEGWKKTAARGDHSALVFDKEEGWSLKYNLVWDRVFGSGLFDESFYQSELRWYIKRQNAYGVPLDSRKDYTKSDWLVWAAAFTKDRAERETLLAPPAAFLGDTPNRVPFSDWYDTVTGKQIGFQNRTVQGGLFMPLLADEWSK